MLELTKPNQVLAFHDDLELSRDTRHLVELALLRRLPVQLWNSQREFQNLVSGDVGAGRMFQHALPG